MATSRQSQHAPTNKPRTYITTNLSQPPLARQPAPTPHPTPNPDAPINRNLDANGRPSWWSRMKFDSPRDRVQPKLTVGAPNDQYEQEADRVADQVMSMPDAATQSPVQREGMPEEELQTKPLAAAITPLVQREEMPEEEDLQMKSSGTADIQREEMPAEEEDLQMKPLDTADLQREEMPSEEEDLQMKSLGTADLQREALSEKEDSLQTKLSPTPEVPDPTPSLEVQLSNTQGSGSPLPHDVRSFMEPRFGADFSQVRVHTGSESVQMNRDLNAQAFTHKQNLYFGAGKSPAKDALTAHELTHVVQQAGTHQPKIARSLSTVKVSSDFNNSEKQLQRKIGDGHDLTRTDPMFKGDPVLEAVFDDERHLRPGDKGDHVKKIQQALLMFDPSSLPKSGADEKYGSETRKAVRNFQLKQKDLTPAFGNVGPKTIKRLDELGPEPEPPIPPISTTDLVLQTLENSTPEALVQLRKDAKFLNSIQKTMSATEFSKAAAILILVVPNEVVDRDAARREAIRILSTQLGGSKKTARATIDNSNIEVVIVPKDKLMTDLPQFSSLKGKKTFDGRPWETTRGVDGAPTGGKVFTAITEENLLGQDCTATFNGKPVNGSYARGYSTTSHEFAHALHKRVLSDEDREIISNAFSARKAVAKNKPDDPDQWVDGREGCYASQTEFEFFAQLSNAYLGTNAGFDPELEKRKIKDSRQNTKEWVKDHEPVVFKVLERIYGNSSISNANPRS